MEDTLGATILPFSNKIIFVLILVLMEDTLGDDTATLELLKKGSLNPCFNGRYSRRAKRFSHSTRMNVLILVLMEDTLGGRAPWDSNNKGFQS